MVCLGLVTGTASASVPDANGVFHGCYGTLTGNVRIVDGRSCGLFERPVSWHQTGPVGPAGASVTGRSINAGDSNCPAGGVALTLGVATTYVCNGVQGPQGPQGPEGPSGSAKVVVDFAYLVPAVPTRPNSQAKTFAKKFIAPANGKCIVSLSANIDNAVATPIEMYFTYLKQGGTWTFYSSRAVLQGTETIQGSTVDAVFMEAGESYEFGLTLQSFDTGVPAYSIADATLVWTCKYD